MSEEIIKPSEWVKLLDEIEKIIPLPHWLKVSIFTLILAALVLVIILAVVKSLSLLQELWLDKIKPRLYKAEQRQLSRGRMLFARHLRREIEARNSLENWRDEEFAELEAEVEAEGAKRSFLPQFRASKGIRREHSLTAALAKSTERLVLVEGDPGSGKSVALRHVAYHLADRAASRRRVDTKLPVYVNLKELVRAPDQPIDRALIREFVLTSMNRVNDRMVTEFLDANFDKGIGEGLWVFLFDSFDEIPDVLSSTEADDVVVAYSTAIGDFLSGINSCRGVVASREYRGPARRDWKKFRILELSARRQNDLVRLAFINYASGIDDLYTGLASSTDDVRGMVRNPMLLGLLCEHVRLKQPFPQTTYDVFSKYIDSRFERDSFRVTERHRISSDELRLAGC